MSVEDQKFIFDIVEKTASARSIEIAGRFLHQVFVRLGRDSVEGRAVAWAIGLDGGETAAETAQRFGVTSEFVVKMQIRAAAKLGDMASPVAPHWPLT